MTVILTLFSHKVPDATKAKVARKLLHSPKDIGLGKPGLSEHVGQQTHLEDFVGQASWLLIEEEDVEWLSDPPAEWYRNEAHMEKQLQVTHMGGECHMVSVAGATPTLPLPHLLFVKLSLLATPRAQQKHAKSFSGHTNFGHSAPSMVTHLRSVEDRAERGVTMI